MNIFENISVRFKRFKKCIYVKRWLIITGILFTSFLFERDLQSLFAAVFGSIFFFIFFLFSDYLVGGGPDSTKTYMDNVIRDYKNTPKYIRKEKLKRILK